MFKKITGSLLALTIVCGAVVGFNAPAFAEVDPATSVVQAVDVVNNSGAADVNGETKAARGTGTKVKSMVGYDQWYQLVQEAKAMITENKALRAQIKTELQALSKEDRATFKDYLTGKKAEMTTLRDQQKALKTTQEANWAAFKTAAKVNDQAAMQSVFDAILSVRIEKNALMTQVNTITEEILATI